jgi:hypothetical protein
LVFGIPPSVKKEGFHSPFIGEIFEKIAEESERPVRWKHRPLLVARLEIIGERAGFTVKCAVRILQHWN